MGVSPDGKHLATVSRDPYSRTSSLVLFHGNTLEPYMRIETDADAYRRWACSVGFPSLLQCAPTHSVLNCDHERK